MWDVVFIDKYNIENTGIVYAESKADAALKCFEVFECVIIKSIYKVG
ncbi:MULTISPECIES: hypothetical protein [Bacillus cereus group]|uniref:Uncharacterized protein n=1 Tax=Bacillus cereus TaxID=1396 RepID=A0ABD7DJH2_BACCE|nr:MULTISPECIES: hypothetical protein [Bacillus cereus group]QRY16941.1 hypothetical protein JTF64_06715 [Bacillus cereus]